MLTPDLIYGLSEAYLKGRYDSPRPTPAFHFKMWEYCCLPDRKVAIAAPRGHAKSTAISHAYALAEMLFREHKYLVIISDTETQSSQFLGNIKTELKENEPLIKAFGPFEFIKDTEADVIIKCGDGHKFRIRSRGAAQAMRGMLWDGSRPDLIICDDLESDELVMSKDRREKLMNWFYGAVLPAMSENGRIRVVGTILHMDSVLEKLMPKERSPFTIHHELYEYDSNQFGQWKSIKFRAHNEDMSVVLWPERWSKELLQAEREDYVSKGLGDKYSQEYLNYPIDASDAYFRQVDMNDLRDTDAPLNYYIGVDLAITTKTRSDYTAFVVVGVDHNGFMKVVDVRRMRAKADDILTEFVALENKYSPEFFVVEKGTIWAAISPGLHKISMEMGVFPTIKEMPATADKEARARPLQARMRMGGMQFDKGADWYSDLESEMMRFPRDRHDDQVDALAYVGLALKNVIEAQTQEELEDEEFSNDYAEHFGSEGTSRWCGY